MFSFVLMFDAARFSAVKKCKWGPYLIIKSVSNPDSLPEFHEDSNRTKAGLYDVAIRCQIG